MAQTALFGKFQKFISRESEFVVEKLIQIFTQRVIFYNLWTNFRLVNDFCYYYHTGVLFILSDISFCKQLFVLVQET